MFIKKENSILTELRNIIASHLVNSMGWTTNRKIIVIESDDWGSIRMPSNEVYKNLLETGVPVDQSPYCKYDSLASEDDLEILFEVLSKFKDHKDNPVVITANAVMTNPDFERIRESNFTEYYYELFTDSFKRYPKHVRCFDLWKEGINAGLFFPQSHGREHVNFRFWLELLRERAYDFQLAFDNNLWGLSNDVYPHMERSIQASFDTVDDISYQIESIKEGLDLFEQIFGFRSESFIANNYTWSSCLNRVLKDEGVKYLQGMKYQVLPSEKGDTKRKKIRHYIGEQNEEGQYFLVRNCFFEPSLKQENFDNVGNCLNSIAISFLWKKPAIIGSHRLNYVGFLDQENRDQNIKTFEKLLASIIKKWPDVEFLTSSQLGRLIEEDLLAKHQ